MNETELYGPILNWILAKFRTELEQSILVAPNHDGIDVSTLDWFEGEGRWMRPDLAFVHVFRRPFDASATLNLHTFEVKTDRADLLPALHQTLAHGRFADFVYLVAPTGPSWTVEVVSQAKRFGVGLHSFRDVNDFRTFECLAQATRCAPEPDLRSQFLDKALTKSGKVDDVKRWLKL